ncbi:MAG: type II toxin-antitoxin system death-on-curing family toxin [Cyanobacteria bacterium J06629_18]
MIRYLVLIEVIELHRQIIEQSGGALGIRDLGALESALAQPYMTFSGEELYPTLVDKASAIGFSLVMNHPFIDGNKRIGHAAMEVFLVMNGVEIDASVDEQESIFLSLASGKLKREEFTHWLKSHVKVR